MRHASTERASQAHPETVRIVIIPSATRAGAAAGAIQVPRYEMKTKVIEIQFSFTSASIRNAM